MNKHHPTLHKVAFLGLLIGGIPYRGVPAEAPPGVVGEYAVVGLGANHKVMQRTDYEPGLEGRSFPRVHTYTAIASGMHYTLPDGTFAPSDPAFIFREKDAMYVAERCQHKLTIPQNLVNHTGLTLECTASDGSVFRTTILGLNLYAPSAGKSLQVSSVRSCEAEQTAPGELVFWDAFDGLRASVRIRNFKGSYHQEVLLHEQLSQRQLATLGFENADDLRLEVWTEFFNPPALRSNGRPDAGSALQLKADKPLDFGALKIHRGTAFLESAPSRSTRVSKEWFEQTGRTQATRAHGARFSRGAARPLRTFIPRCPAGRAASSRAE